jgi:hypothetical protein
VAVKTNFSISFKALVGGPLFAVIPIGYAIVTADGVVGSILTKLGALADLTARSKKGQVFSNVVIVAASGSLQCTHAFISCLNTVYDSTDFATFTVNVLTFQMVSAVLALSTFATTKDKVRSLHTLKGAAAGWAGGIWCTDCTLCTDIAWIVDPVGSTDPPLLVWRTRALDR